MCIGWYIEIYILIAMPLTWQTLKTLNLQLSAHTEERCGGVSILQVIILESIAHRVYESSQVVVLYLTSNIKKTFSFEGSSVRRIIYIQAQPANANRTSVAKQI